MRDEKLLKFIARRLKELRENEGISQADFLNDTGIHAGRIETGKRDVSISTIKAICNYFDLSISDFFKDLK
jgi:transcriptional regulator with XRE-family HTH domain